MSADVVDALWQQAEPRVFITRGEFVRDLEGWEIEPVEVGGALAFAALTRGPEFHFASFGTGATISLGMIRERLQPLIDRHGYVCTRTPIDEARQRRINELLGFVPDGQDEFFVHYRMTAGAWSRSQPCQS